VTNPDDDDEIYFVRTTPTGAFEARTRWVDMRRTAGSSSGAGSLLMPAVRPGNLYWRLPIGATTSTATVANGGGTFTPLMVPVACTLTEIGVEVVGTVGAAGSVVRLGVYADSATAPGFPGALIQDFGTVATTTNGNQVLTGLTLALQPYVLYWTVAIPQGTPATNPTLRIYTGAANYGAGSLATYMWSSVQTFGTPLGALPADASAIASTCPGGGSPISTWVRLSS
jgi:hypothetical protein